MSALSTQVLAILSSHSMSLECCCRANQQTRMVTAINTSCHKRQKARSVYMQYSALYTWKRISIFTTDEQKPPTNNLNIHRRPIRRHAYGKCAFAAPILQHNHTKNSNFMQNSTAVGVIVGTATKVIRFYKLPSTPEYKYMTNCNFCTSYTITCYYSFLFLSLPLRFSPAPIKNSILSVINVGISFHTQLHIASTSNVYQAI